MTDRDRTSRREFLKKAAYIAPAVLTLSAIPSFASAGSWNQYSRGRGNDGVGNGLDPQPGAPGTPPQTNPNDGPGTSPGSPGSRRGRFN